MGTGHGDTGHGGDRTRGHGTRRTRGHGRQDTGTWHPGTTDTGRPRKGRTRGHGTLVVGWLASETFRVDVAGSDVLTLDSYSLWEHESCRYWVLCPREIRFVTRSCALGSRCRLSRRNASLVEGRSDEMLGEGTKTLYAHWRKSSFEKLTGEKLTGTRHHLSRRKVADALTYEKESEQLVGLIQGGSSPEWGLVRSGDRAP